MRWNRYITTFLVTILAVLTLTVATDAGSKPEITSHTAQVLDRAVSINVQWHSENPITSVKIIAGQGEKEIKVDEYDNRRNPSGYSGEVSAVIPIDPALYTGTLPYQIQLVDELRQKSDLLSGQTRMQAVAMPGMMPPPGMMVPPGMMQQPGMMPPQGVMQGMPPGQQDDGWGKSNIRAGKGQGTEPGSDKSNDMLDKLQKVAERFDSPPTLDVVKVNVLGPENVSFSSKANDDKGIRDITFRVYDDVGNKVGEQVLTNLGRKWEGSTQPIKLTGGGNFRVVAQATDTAGNTSKEQIVPFSMRGVPASQPVDQPQLPVVTPPPVVVPPPPVVVPPPPVVVPPPPVVVPPPPVVVPPPPVVVPPPPVVVPPPPVVVPPPPVVVPPPPVVVPPPPVVVPPPPVVVPPPPVVVPPPPVVVLPPPVVVLPPPVVVPPPPVIVPPPPIVISPKPPVIVPPPPVIVPPPPVVVPPPKPPIVTPPPVVVPPSGMNPLQPPADPVIYTNGNIAGVQNGPSKTTAFAVDASHRVTFIYTYHYFNGGKLPGTIGLKHTDGTVYGPWPAKGAVGQGGVPNAYWFVLPNVEIKAGSYTVLDSDNATWSQNSGSGNSGFVEVRGIKTGTPPPVVTGMDPLKPPADPVIYTNGNIAGVQNGPSKTTAFAVDASHRVTFIYTYHYFNGGKLPGTIALKHSDGTVYGPWPAKGAVGQGGVPNAYWFVLPNLEIKAGSYTVLDSDNGTWSQNSGSGGAGFVEVRGIKTGTPPPVFPILPGMEDNTDRMGMDYRSFDLPAADPKLCSSACEAEAQCKAYTFVRPGVQGLNARCWLKTSVPNPAKSPCCVSGVKAQPQSGMDPLQPPADPVIYTNGNIAGVQNGPSKATSFSVDASHRVTFIYTYHYFNGGKLPGTIGLKHTDGTVYGPWVAKGAVGQGGVPNAYWFVLPNVEIKAGSYTVLDSDNATWSQNSGSGNSGFVEVRGIKASVPVPTGELLKNGDFSQQLSGWNIEDWFNASTGRGEVLFKDRAAYFISPSGNNRIGIMQTVGKDVSGCSNLMLKAVVRADTQTLDGTGWQGREAPVAVYAGYIDSAGIDRSFLPSFAQPAEPQGNRMFWNGFYFKDPTGNSGNSHGAKVQAGQWYSYVVDLMSLNPKPKTLKFAGVQGSGWAQRSGAVSSMSLVCNGDSRPLPVPIATTPIQAVSGTISGKWETSEGQMTLSQTGSTVTGVYAQDNGHITGTFNNNILDGYWFEDSSAQRCTTPRSNGAGQSTYYWGGIKYQFSNDKFSGTWGYCESNAGHPWTGSRMK